MSALQISSPSFQPAMQSRRDRTDASRKELQQFNSATSISPDSQRAIISPTLGGAGPRVQREIVGDSRHLEQTVARHTARLRRVAFNILHNKEDAEDAVQDGLCKAFASLRSFQGRSSMSTWLTRIVINSALMFRRRKNSRPEASLDQILDSNPERLRNEIDDRGLGPEEICNRTEIRGRVEQSVRLLPPRLRSAIELHLRGLTETDSIRTLGIRKPAFKARIFRARHRLVAAMRESLNPACATTKHKSVQRQFVSP